MNKLILRPYQEDMINRARQSFASGNRSVLLQGPTGCGKTALTVDMMARAEERGKSSFFLVHQNELLQQTSRALWKQHLQHGMICQNRRRSTMPAQVASAPTLVRRLQQYNQPDLIIIDEAHRATANTYRRITDHFAGSRVLGLTATPERTDGTGLGSQFDDLIIGPSVRELIEWGYLCDYEIYGPPSALDMRGVHSRGGDYVTAELEGRMNKPAIIGDAVAHYVKHARGKRCVVMCVSIKHAEHTVALYRQSGVPAEIIDGRMSDAERDAALARFSRGDTWVLVNVQLMIEGVDIPGIEVVQWLRPTQSLIVWMQGNGRGFRPYDDKDRLLIFDHVGNWHRHGLPDDDRHWSLAGRKKGKRKAADEEPDVNVQQCLHCYSVFRPGPDLCPACGQPVPKQKRAELEVVEGELQRVEVEKQRRDRKREQGSARTLRDLIQVGQRRGMKKPAAWAASVLAGRQGGRKATARDFTEAYRVMAQMEKEATQ